MWFLVAGWGAVIWRLLTLPPEETPDVTFIPFGDKFGHVGLYGVWGLLICSAAQRSFRALTTSGVRLTAVLAAAAYGVATEIYQPGIGREAEVLDLLADVVGAVVAQWLFFSPKTKALLRKVASRLPFFARTGTRQVPSPLRESPPSDSPASQHGTKTHK
jgi:VanZ family protein